MRWWIRIHNSMRSYIQIWPRDYRFWIRNDYWNCRGPKKPWHMNNLPKRTRT